MTFDISWHLTFHDSWHFMPFLVFLHLKFHDSWHLMTFNILLHFPRTNLIGLFPQGRFYPSSTIVFIFMCARHYFWTFGVLCIFGVFNNQLYYSTNLCFIDLIVVALWNRLKKDAVCLASRDPNQLLVQDSQSVNASMTPK